MLSSWFSTKSSRRSQPRQAHSNSPPAPDNVQPGNSDVSSISQSTVGPLRTPANLTSTSDVPLDVVHTTHINDPSLYATTPSLVHSIEKEAATLRMSDPLTSHQDVASYQRDSVQRVFPPERTLFTPQDAIIAQVLGRSVPPIDPASAPPPSNTARQSVLQTTSDSPPPSSSARPGLALPLYDPFSGARLGEHTPVTPSAVTPGDVSSFAPIPMVDDRKQWSSLERILELQAEVAAMHTDMEGVGGRAVGGNTSMAGVGVAEGGQAAPRKRSRRGQTLPIGDEEPEEPEAEGGAGTGTAVSEISTEHSDDEAQDEEDDDDIHVYGKKRRDEEFARLAEQFAQRKAAIGGIMNKLDDLSMALKAFHALPPPLFDLAGSSSRTDTLSSAPSVTPPSHPLHIHPGQTSSGLPSISPSQAVSSITHSASPTSLPVPPLSALAPSIPPSASPGLRSIVTPALPRTDVPRILPGAPHMESPADMESSQSIFQGMSRASG